MLCLMPQHGSGKVRCRIILGAASDYRIAKNFTASLAHLFAFSVAPRLSTTFSRFSRSRGLTSATGGPANKREHVFFERIHYGCGVQLRRPSFNPAGVPFKSDILKGVLALHHALLTFLPPGHVWINPASHTLFSLFPLLACICQTNIGIYANGQQLFLAIDAIF